MFERKKGVKYYWNSTIRIKDSAKPIKKVSDVSARLWATARNICLKRYGKRCFLCGKTGEIHIHHFLFTRTQRPDLKYDQSNLVALCPNCHNHHGADKRFYELKEIILKKIEQEHANELEF